MGGYRHQEDPLPRCDSQYTALVSSKPRSCADVHGYPGSSSGAGRSPIAGHGFELHLRPLKAPRLLYGSHGNLRCFRRGKLSMAQMPQLLLGLILMPAQLLLEGCDLPRIRLLGEDE
jgi:hypothetical protein